MIELEEKEFFKLQGLLGKVPFNQSFSWFKFTYNREIQYKFFIDNIENPKICCWGAIHKSKIFKNVLVINGECYAKDITENQVKRFYKVIADLPVNRIEISSVHNYDPIFEIGVRQAGFIRPLILSLCPMSIIVDTLEPSKCNRNWKRNVKKAIDNKLTFTLIEDPTLNEVKLFCKLFDELSKTKKLQFSLKPESLLNLLKFKDFRMFFVNKAKGVPVAGRIIYLSQNESYDVFAANSDEARISGASFFMMDQIFNYLKNNNIPAFDFGRIGPGVSEVNSVYEFKRYSGGIPIAYNGQWVISKQRIKEIIYYGYLLCFSKIKRY